MMKARNCRNCGAPLPKGGSVCQYCMTEHEEPNNNPKNSARIFIIIVMLIALGMMAAGFILYKTVLMDAPENSMAPVQSSAEIIV